MLSDALSSLTSQVRVIAAWTVPTSPGLDVVPRHVPSIFKAPQNQTTEISIPEGHSTLLNDKISY